MGFMRLARWPIGDYTNTTHLVAGVNVFWDAIHTQTHCSQIQNANFKTQNTKKKKKIQKGTQIQKHKNTSNGL